MQVDAAIESMWLVVETHHDLLWHGTGRLRPHHGWKNTTLPENPTRGLKLCGFEPVYLWDRPRPTRKRDHEKYQVAAIDRGRHPGFAQHEGHADGPGT
jgi:hypothetical protein